MENSAKGQNRFSASIKELNANEEGSIPMMTVANIAFFGMNSFANKKAGMIMSVESITFRNFIKKYVVCMSWKKYVGESTSEYNGG